MEIDLQKYPDLQQLQNNYWHTTNIKFITKTFISSMLERIGSLDTDINIYPEADSGIILMDDICIQYSHDGFILDGPHRETYHYPAFHGGDGNGGFFAIYKNKELIYSTDTNLGVSEPFPDDESYETMLLLQRVLFFLKYAPVEIKIVNNNSNDGIRCINDKAGIGTKIQVVDSTYFTTIVRTDGFNVRGHFRLQPIGQGRKEKKLKWINDFKKSGYTKKAKILSQS
jgi:hypothetical protein